MAESEWEIKAPNLNWALKLNVVAAAVSGFVILVLRFATRPPSSCALQQPSPSSDVFLKPSSFVSQAGLS